MSKIIQFNWRRHWKKKVEPHLNKELVQLSIDLGMRRLVPKWKTGDPPWIHGAITGDEIVEGGLSWYQPVRRCHWIAFFAMAIGVINYPDLDWTMVSSERHTVPVGFGPNGEPMVVMDILNFAEMSAEQSIAFATDGGAGEVSSGWEKAFQCFEAVVVPLIRENCCSAEVA